MAQAKLGTQTNSAALRIVCKNAKIERLVVLTTERAGGTTEIIGNSVYCYFHKQTKDYHQFCQFVSEGLSRGFLNYEHLDH